MKLRPPPDEADTRAEQDAYYADCEAWLDDHTPDRSEW